MQDEKKVQPWEPMQITYVGNVREVVQVSHGGGKTEAIVADPGEPQKTQPTETT